MNGNKEKPTEAVTRSQEADRSSLETDKKFTDLDALKHGKETVRKSTKDSLKQLRKGVYSVTLEARRGVDRAPLKHVEWLKRAEKYIEQIERKHLVELENLIPPNKPLTPQEFAVLQRQIKEITARHKHDATQYWHALVYSVKAFTGVRGALKTEDYALFDSLLENINSLYSKDIKIGEMISRIQQRTIVDKDWDVICSHIDQYPYEKNVTKDQTRINMSITAMFVQMMDANQRYELVRRYYKKSGDAKKTTELIKTFAGTNVINIAQMQKLLSEVQGNEYAMSPEEEKTIRDMQEQTIRMTREVRRTMQSPLVINSAERILNPKSMAACAVIALGSLGMAMNYLSAFNKGKGAGRFLAGLSKPWFLVSAAVTAGGVHALGSGMRPGEVPGFFDKMFPAPKRMENPFGVAKNSEAQDESFTELVNLCTSYKAVEKYLLDTNGIGDIMAFYGTKKADVKRMQEEAKMREVTKPKPGKKSDLFEEYLEYIATERKNSKGKSMLLEIDKIYGRQTARMIFFRLFVSVHNIGALSAGDFKSRNIPHQDFTFYQLYRHRAGLETLKVPVKTVTGEAAGQASSQSATSHK